MNRCPRAIGVRPVASRDWADHYRHNRDHPPKIPWIDGPQLTDAQRRVLAGSIAEFELGERSEGRTLMRFVRTYAQRVGDPDYVEAMSLFIAEENRHARYLALCLKIEGMPQAEKTTADSAFRFARRLAGLELSIRVLVTAEIIAQVYYRGLRDATRSTALRAVCRQILRDEGHHIRFQCERLAMLRARRSGVTLWRRRVGDRALMTIATLVVWRNHGRALRLGGYTFRRFRRHVSVKFARAQAIAQPGRYVWDNVAAVVVS